MALKGVLVFRGDSGAPTTHYSKSQIVDVTAKAALDTLGTALAAYSDANLAKVSMVETTLVTDSAPGVDANVDYKGVIYFRDAADLKVHSVTIPALKSTAVINTPEGDRVTSVALTAIVAAIATATGNTLTGLYGVVIQKR